MYRSYLELAVPEVLSEQKFSTKIQESRDLYVRVSDLMALEIARKKVPSYVEKLGMITEKEFKQGTQIVVDKIYFMQYNDAQHKEGKQPTDFFEGGKIWNSKK